MAADAQDELRETPLTHAKRWAFVLVPGIALLELVLQLRQASSAAPERDWTAAREAVSAIAQPEDLVVFAPHWVDQIGRQYFGDAIATLGREARPDDTRFPRAIEVAVHGEHLPELKGWKRAAEARFGAITVTTLENPAPVQVKDDLLAHAGPQGMRVARVDAAGREQDCAWTPGVPATGNLGFGPAIPGDKFVCPGGGFVGVTVLAPLDYAARRCFLAPPLGDAILRIRFLDVRFGAGLHGHHGIYVEAERHKDGAPVTATFRAGERMLGTMTHVDGDGWKGFELNTADLAGQRGELTVDLATRNPNKRVYCFEADTR